MAETVEELKQEMVDRYAELSDEEKDVIGSMVPIFITYDPGLSYIRVGSAG